MDHSMMDHSKMDHSMMDHSKMDHSMMDHAMMDHSSMDHSMMNHSTMDHTMMNHSALNESVVNHDGHSGMNHAGMDHSGMSMTFHFGVTATVLFEGWKVGGVSTLLLSCVGIFFMAFIYEGIKYYRENLLWKTYNALHYRAVDGNAVPDAENHKTVVREIIRKEE
ncbi:High affinity copper uptake protein 1 [Frankliniella fusca]|uniref:Copper transport protein n=1 Tax=Frankliniella fusca TaxID=407009 RepID=A0AAE1HFB3_9NEOP|nr:High affinity copper uptake protein 1 [Frankliniella fusca]